MGFLDDFLAKLGLGGTKPSPPAKPSPVNTPAAAPRQSLPSAPMKSPAPAPTPPPKAMSKLTSMEGHMSITDNLATFGGKPVEDFNPERGIENPEGVCYRIRIDWDMHEDGVEVPTLIKEFVNDPRAEEVTELIIGLWSPESGDDSPSVVEALVSASARLPRLRALFFGDITPEEQEISWIQQSDLGPLIRAFPLLEEFHVRGGSGLGLDIGRHDNLRKLVVQTGGLSKGVLHSLADSELPHLTHLELWLGTDDYGGDSTVDDLPPLLVRYGNLTFLGLMNSIYTDAIVTALNQMTLPANLETLDLSMGNLSDAGGNALLEESAQARLKGLKRLNLRHHYLSGDMLARVAAVYANANLADQEEADEDDDETYRYCEVTE